MTGDGKAGDGKAWKTVRILLLRTETALASPRVEIPTKNNSQSTSIKS